MKSRKRIVNTKKMFRIFLRRTAVMAAVGLLGVATFNLLADPYRAYRVVNCRSLDLCKSQAGSRIAKAELLDHGEKFDAIIFGSSRAEIALDPKAAEWGKQKVVNVSLRAPSLYEIQQAVDFAMSHQRPRLAVICVDFFISNNARVGVEDFAKSRFNPNLNVAAYHLDNLLSLAASKYAFEDVRRWLKKDTGKYDLNGFFEGKDYDKKDSQRRAFVETLRILPEAGIFYNPRSVEVVGTMIDRCISAGTDVALVILPLHAASLERIRDCGRWPDMERWRRDLTAMAAGRQADKVALWDFTSYRDFSAETIPPTFEPTGNEMKFYFEASHFSRRLGNIIIERINGGSALGELELAAFPREPIEFLCGWPECLTQRYGVRLTPQNIASHLAALDRDRQVYVIVHGPDAALGRQRSVGK